MTAPDHGTPATGFRNPWPGAAPPEKGPGALLRWQLERLANPPAPLPPPEALPVVTSSVANPRAADHELRVTWVGHSTFLIQIGGWNVLTDPVWSPRASPVQWAGPARLVPPGLEWGALPPVDAVVLSHDHYDHLDRATVRRLVRRSDEGLRWLAPLGFRSWLRKEGAREVLELDWWQEARLGNGGGDLRVAAAPAQHWSRRSPLDRRRDRLWCSWVIRAGDARVYFGGDTGYFPAFPEIRARFGPFDAVLLPIGAYAPRWFMRAAHMDPEEAVRAYRDLGQVGVFVPMHWGTFRLTDEPVLEPPRRLRAAWRAAGLPPAELAVLRHGETLIRETGNP